MKNVLFIGLGHMGSSLVKGILANENFNIKVYGFDTFTELQEKVVKALSPRMTGISSIEEIVTENIDFVVIGTRPDAVDELCTDLDKLDLSGKTIISMANAVEISSIKANFKNQKDLTIVRMMPNMNASINESVTALAHVGADKEKLDFIIEMFKNCGIVEIVDEDKFGTLTAISGCMPAYVFTFLKAITDYAVEKGFEKAQAFRIVETAVIGSIKNGSTSGVDLKTMIDQICVPNGSTIEGQKVLNEENFEEIVKKCLAAADKKASPSK